VIAAGLAIAQYNGAPQEKFASEDEAEIVPEPNTVEQTAQTRTIPADNFCLNPS
jgi:hypothetical protein